MTPQPEQEELLRQDHCESQGMKELKTLICQGSDCEKSCMRDDVKPW